MAEPSKRTSGASGRKKKSGWRRFFTWLGITVLALLVAGGAVVGVAYATVKLPDPNADFQTNTSFVYYRDGKEKIGNYQIQNRQSLPYDKIPQNVKDAIVAGENRSFWTDPGFSVSGMTRAVISVLRGEDVVGGSTITQQYIKVMYLTQDKSYTRKFTEILLAAKMGNELSKEQILEGYLNTVYFGRGAYGVQAASLAFFNKSVAKLSDSQAIALTAMANDPGNLDPSRGDKQAADLLERYQYTINGLVEMGKMTDAEKAKIYYQLPKFPTVERDSQFGGPKGYLLNMVQEELRAKGFTDQQISGGGLNIVTTFDAKAQEAAVKAAQTVTSQTVGGSTKKAAQLHAGLASIDVETGGVIALYGGPDFLKGRNWATTPRPTGSTFKPYALGTALSQGFTLNDILNGSSFVPPGGTRPVQNAGSRNYGPVTLQQATTNSINTAYVDLETNMKDGPRKTLEFAQKVGLPKAGGWDPVTVLPLGIPEVSPLSQASGYATFASGGKHVPPHVVAQVKDASGAVLYKADTHAEQVIDADVANDVAAALTHVVQDGTASRAGGMGFPIAGKTGTYYNRGADGGAATQACWFVGMSKQISTAVMFVAGKDGTDDLNKLYPPGFFGAGPPLSAWMSYMQVAQQGLKNISFDQPTHRVSTQTPTLPPRTTTPTATKSPTASATPTETATATATATSTPSDEPTDQPTGQPSNRPSERPSPQPSGR